MGKAAMIRTTVELTEEQHMRLKYHCVEHKTKLAVVIRQGIDQILGGEPAGTPQAARSPAAGAQSRFRPVAVQGEPVSSTISRDRGIR